MGVDFERTVKDFLTFYKVQSPKITFSFDNTIYNSTIFIKQDFITLSKKYLSIPVIIFGNEVKPVKGLRNIVTKFSNFKSENIEDHAVLDDWLEYIETHSVDFDALSVLREVNDYLEDKVYFVGYKYGPIDVLMYYLLYNIYSTFTYQDKENYTYVSRWFNTMQHLDNFKLGKPIIPFTRCCLYT
ncbi:eukaryotic translation elongation factor 1 epsilon-1, putative [Pediculus humanus corporis]|uniref:Eukaryotic translation elongation factor 1 epsilon-1, putative n=1 Tax=Pediculus humanus subsp. corporis TaxID=121224 RepID=E0VBJ5_PEDHC|nr:eukaryotic translation elongation factor 1 epsilon-1, putative [Pediculus humanus corporis]EEB10751.1 eukaryotic translation elongation factor 1 epsilon-1, putative [Pediculus humanus corporis]